MLASLFAGDHDHKLRNLSTIHPVFELRHDLLDVCLDLIIGRNCSGQKTLVVHCSRLLCLPIMVKPYFLTLAIQVSNVGNNPKTATYAVKSSAGYTPR